MGGWKPGPVCCIWEGPDWIDDGTICRSRSYAPVPAGSGEPVAAPKPARPPEEKGLLAYDIRLIRDSPFGHTKDGGIIAGMLRNLLKADHISYGETSGDPPARGEWDGTSIIVNQEYSGNIVKTTVELVHEASHALWRQRHPIGHGKTETTEESADNEYYAIKNQLAIYKWLRDVKKFPPDPLMDLRLEREAKGTLKAAVQSHEQMLRGEEP